MQRQRKLAQLRRLRQLECQQAKARQHQLARLRRAHKARGDGQRKLLLRAIEAPVNLPDVRDRYRARSAKLPKVGHVVGQRGIKPQRTQRARGFGANFGILVAQRGQKELEFLGQASGRPARACARLQDACPDLRW